MNAPIPASGPASGPSADTAAPLLQLHGITVSYGKNEPVLSDLDMSVCAGEVYGLLGLNGTGKSALMSTVLGLVPYSDEISVAGHSWSVVSLGRIGVSINGPAFYPQLLTTDNLKVHAHLTGTGKSCIAEVLDLVGLHAGNKHTRAFSTDMKVRLSLAMALLTDPDIMLLDEPINSLGPEAIVDLRTLLRNLAASGKAVVVFSHQPGEAEKNVDHLGVLAGGRLVHEGPLTDFTASGRSLGQAFFTAVSVA